MSGAIELDVTISPFSLNDGNLLIESVIEGVSSFAAPLTESLEFFPYVISEMIDDIPSI